MEDITNGAQIVKQLYPPYKQVLAMLHKPAPWGKTPKTIEEAAPLWRATVHGRRCTYVHACVSHALGSKKLSATVVKACELDAYKSELDALIREIVNAKKNNR